MKWLIILFLIFILFAMIVVRYRRHINAGIEIFRMFRQLKNQNKPEEKRLEKKVVKESVPLVRCAKCGTWTPQTSALNLRSKVFYCSTDCMEKAVVLNR